MSDDERPLPNGYLNVGDLCPKSFAQVIPGTNVATVAPGWGVCRDCGETVNTRGRFIPEHKIPELPS